MGNSVSDAQAKVDAVFAEAISAGKITEEELQAALQVDELLARHRPQPRDVMPPAPIFYKRCPACGGLYHMDRVLDFSECPHSDSHALPQEAGR